MRYREEIDGLRAFAVIPVILFHAGLPGFEGGFVGVDIFFVISGYLITSIILSELSENRFSFSNFYIRRIRRIVPALFFVTIICIPLSWTFMSPTQVDDFNKSLIAVALFMSNILFWRESGYFSIASEEKPLLHTWSLAVEEQFYLIFPLFAYILFRLRKDKMLYAFGFVALFSLVLCEFSWRNMPSANFYLLPTRLWEIMSGSFIAALLAKGGPKSNNLLATLGGTMLGISLLFFHSGVPSPSVYTILPVAGTVLLLMFADKKTWVGKFLSQQIFIWIGLISYSAYLWHQPLFAFARVVLYERPSVILLLGLSLLSLTLATFSYHFVEKPFRKGIFSRGVTLILFLLCWLTIFGASALHSRFIQDDTKNNQHYKWLHFNQTEEFETLWEVSKCYIEKGSSTWSDFDKSQCLIHGSEGTNILVVGDSHAAQLVSSLRAQNGVSVSNVSASGCRPLLYEKASVSLDINCLKRNEYLFSEYLPDLFSKVDILLLSARWMNNETEEMQATFDLLKSLGVRVIIVGSEPRFVKNVPELLAKYSTGIVPSRYLDNSRILTDEKLREIVPKDFIFLSLKDHICSSDCKLLRDEKLIIFDREHLTPFGAERFVEEELVPYLR